MSKKSTASKMALVSLVALFFVIGSFATSSVALPSTSPASLDCSKAKDNDIIKEVIKNIRKGFNRSDRKQLLLFNITCNQGIVTLKGAALSNTANPQDTKNRVIDIVKNTDCVKSVNSDGLGVVPLGHCGPLEKACNGGCIGRNETCHLIG